MHADTKGDERRYKEIHLARMLRSPCFVILILPVSRGKGGGAFPQGGSNRGVVSRKQRLEQGTDEQGSSHRAGSNRGLVSREQRASRDSGPQCG